MVSNDLHVVLEYTLSDGSTEPAIVAAHVNTAAYLTAIFQLIEFAKRENMKLTAMDEIIRMYGKLLANPLYAPFDSDDED